MSENWKLSDDDVQVPLGVGEEGAGRETAFVEPRKSPVNAATMALLGVFLASLAIIYLLGLQNRPRSAAAQGANSRETDSAIRELLSKAGKSGDINSVFQNTDQLVQMFYNYPGHSAADLSQLPGNPFEQPGAHRTTMAAPLPTTDNGALLQEQERMRKIAESFAMLKLQSVMISKTMSAAMINGQFVGIGGKVGEFTVSEIDADRVILKAGESKFELKLEHTKLSNN